MKRPQRPALWAVKAACVAGISHRRTGLPCQDAVCWQQGDGYLLAAVADGAGSAAKAEMGAGAATNAAIEWLAGELHRLPSPHAREEWVAFFHEGFTSILQSVEATAAEQQMEAADLATTLILLVGTANFLAAAQIGDGAVVIADETGAMHPLTLPRSGEYLNETAFLHSQGAIASAQVSLWEGTPTALAMLTDGLQMLALTLPEGQPHAPFFEPLWRFARTNLSNEEAERQLTAFLQSPRISARSDDDLTLLLATLQKQG